ncbi:hypothetical protein AOLI_G00086760 [Acnodon oligacanthus]
MDQLSWPSPAYRQIRLLQMLSDRQRLRCEEIDFGPAWSPDHAAVLISGIAPVRMEEEREEFLLDCPDKGCHLGPLLSSRPPGGKVAGTAV